MPVPKHQTSQHGLGLAELIVVMGIMVLMMVIVSALYLQGRDGVRVSTERLDTAGRARRTMDSVAPFVISAIRDITPALEVRDLTPEDLTDACSLLVTTRERFLSPDYNPTALYVPNPLVPAWRYQIRFDPAKKQLLAEQLRLKAGGGDEVDPDVSARVLGRDLDGCGFRQLSPSSVEVSLRTRAKLDDVRRPDGVTTSHLKALLAAPGVP